MNPENSTQGPGKWIGAYQRFITGDGIRRSRFHTYQDRLLDPAAFAYLPQCVSSILLLKLFGYRQPLPWLGFRVVRRLRALIRPDFRILEFGSGMSSLFFASRCAQLVSIEADHAWYETMRTEFTKRGLTNIDYRFRSLEDYSRLDDFPDGSFDLVLVDGARRDEAAVTAVRKCRPGSWILLDNSDVRWPEHQNARATLLAAAAKTPGSTEVYNDLCPFGLQACESTLIQTAS